MKSSKPRFKLKKPKKINVAGKPEGMSDETWQRALRLNSAQQEYFGIEQDAENLNLFRVGSARSGQTYSVEFFCRGSRWNRCSCMDFQTNRLGTCKHLEFVGISSFGRGSHRQPTEPQSSVVIVDYPAGRVIRFRPGVNTPTELKELAEAVFDATGALTDFNFDAGSFIKKAKKLEPEFVWEPEALDMLLQLRAIGRRKAILAEKYADSDFTGLLKMPLLPYQADGVRFAFEEGRTIIADEMGLGKTVQAIATAELLRREGLIDSVLIICPTSLKYQWLAEIRKFSDSTALVVEGIITNRTEQLANPEFFYKIVSYQAIANNVNAGHVPKQDMIVYDEVQRLKNRDTKTGIALRHLESDYVLALTGTPLENKINELYSVTQFVDQFVLGPYYKFTKLTTNFDERGRIVGYKNLHTIADMLSHTMIRRKKADVKLQMPSRTDTRLFVPMTKEQMAIHGELAQQVTMIVAKWNKFRFISEADRKRLLLLLSMMRMVCDSTFILDQKTRHDTKVDEVLGIIENILATDDGKIVVFSQWERMLRLVAQTLEKEGVPFCFLHGGVPSIKRKELIDRFREDPEYRVFLSTDAGATGLNLQSASTLVNVDLPWNPAVLEQRIARIYRLGQENPVQIINMVAKGTIEERMLDTLKFKSNLAAGILDGGEDVVFLESSKFAKIIEIAQEVTAADLPAQPEEQHEQPKKTPKTPAAPAESEATPQPQPEPQPEPQPKPQPHPAPPSPAPKVPSSPEEARRVVAGAMDFLGTLANMLKEPESTKALVDALVTEDPETGKATLSIPVPDKSTVANMLSALGSLLNK